MTISPFRAASIASMRELGAFKGFAVGNPFTDQVENKIGNYGTLAGHTVVSRPTSVDFMKNCDYMTDYDTPTYDRSSGGAQCAKAQVKMMLESATPVTLASERDALNPEGRSASKQKPVSVSKAILAALVI